MPKVTEQDRKDLSKALNYANWSVLGLFVPFLGWFLAGMGLSFIKTVPNTESTAKRIQQVKRAAWAGIVVSSLAFTVWGGLYKYNTSQNKMSREATIKQQNEQTQSDYKKTQYSNCLENKSEEARIKIDNNQSFVAAIDACRYLEP